MTHAKAVARALGAIGHGCDYWLGAGGMKPNAPGPWDEVEGRKRCDCSGFAMWAWGLSRFQKPAWYDTSRIAADARFEGKLFELLASWDDLRLGDGLVWGDRNGRQGHVGIVTGVDPVLVTHCSRGNWLRTDPHDAIQQTDAGIFTRNGAIAVRCKALMAEPSVGADGEAVT